MEKDIDAACIKLSAISARGSKKDFVDLYYILQTIDLNTLIQKFQEKYSKTKYNYSHLLKSLTYFTDADLDPEPDYLVQIDWETVKKFLINKTTEYIDLASK